MEVDVVITYVNGADPKWQKEYRKYFSDSISTSRYLDYNTLPLQIKCIRKYMDYVRNIYVVVSSRSQVKGKDLSNAIVVTHDQIIPSKFLPTFNSCTIEMFLHKIPGLAEHFIYFNDDMFSIAPSRLEDFFEDGKLKMNFKTVKHLDENNVFRVQCKRGCDDAKRLNNILVDESFIKPCHICLPHTKTAYQKVWSQMRNEIERSITRKRSSENYNQYLFALYNYYADNVDIYDLDYVFSDSKNMWFSDVIDIVSNKRCKFICLNDIGRDIDSIKKNRLQLINAFESNLYNIPYLLSNSPTKPTERILSTPKVALCAIAKNENRYIREWVEYYLGIGVSRIYLYDNNDITGERFEDVIQDYISSGRVEVIDRRGIEKEKRDSNRHNLQDFAYEDCYNTHYKEYDWMWFFDIDEFLVSPSGLNIIDYISSKRFSNYDTILVNWTYYGDNGLVHYENKPVMERFKEPCQNVGTQKGFRAGFQCKSIVRCGRKHITPEGNITIHKFLLHGCRLCNSNGEPVKQYTGVKIENICFENLTLNHYITKTIEEYLPRYVGRVDSVSKTGKTFDLDRVARNFFAFNDMTEEKLAIIEKYRTL